MDSTQTIALTMTNVDTVKPTQHAELGKTKRHDTHTPVAGKEIAKMFREHEKKAHDIDHTKAKTVRKSLDFEYEDDRKLPRLTSPLAITTEVRNSFHALRSRISHNGSLFQQGTRYSNIKIAGAAHDDDDYP